VHSGHNCRAANRAFREYVSQSKTGYGRASGENVTLSCNDEPIREYFSPYQAMRAELESGECAVIRADGEVTLCGKHVATIGNDCTQAQALARVARDHDGARVFPQLL